MPCNLRARADVKVSNEMFGKLLTEQVIGNVVKAFGVEQQLGVGTVHDLRPHYREVQVGFGDVKFSIQFETDGFTVFAGNYNGDRAKSERLAKLLAPKLSAVCGLLLQQTIKGTLAQQFNVKQAVTDQASGALVISVEV